MAVIASLPPCLPRSGRTAAVMLIAALCACGCELLRTPPQFPRDHGPHADVRNEWWYFTGTAAIDNGSIIGFEATLFKRLVSRRKGIAAVGHVAVSLPDTREHIFSETVTPPPVDGIEEGATELALTDFYYRFSDDGGIAVAGTGPACAVDLHLTPLTDPVLHGNDGSITMGDGMPSYYYSFPNLATAGTIRVRDRTYAIVSGRTWMDHQWGNFTFLGMRWDWFSLRFDDGGSLMLFQFRNGRGAPVSAVWTRHTASGDVITGSGADIASSRVFVDDNRTCVYPLEWTIEVPGMHGIFSVRPLFDKQAIYSDITPDYWEGLCSVSGSIGGEPAAGFSYAELTGYCN